MPKATQKTRLAIAEAELSRSRVLLARAADTLIRIRLELGAEPDENLVEHCKTVNQRLARIEEQLANLLRARERK